MEGKTVLFWLELVVLVVFLETSVECGAISKRSTAPERNPEGNDYAYDIKYDEYPMVVPRKRAAVLLDRLMVALQKAMDEETVGEIDKDSFRKGNGFGLTTDDNLRTMDLQRRGHGSLSSQQKGRVYWRCYFNAVTCF